MKIGIGLPNTMPGIPGTTLVEWARRSEERGFAGLATLDLFDTIDEAVRTRGLRTIYRQHHPAPAGAEITARRIAAELQKRHIPPEAQ